jgi:hypothetical protein
MAVRPAVYNRSKVGVQSVLGTGVAVTKVLNGGGFTRFKRVVRGGKPHTNSGEQFPSAGVPSSKSHSEFEGDGVITFNTFNYFLEMLFGTVTPVAEGTYGKKRTYRIGNGISITPAYMTIEQGDGNRAKKVIDAHGVSLNLKMSDLEADFTMGVRAGAITDDSTPTTAGLTEFVPSLLNAAKWDVYLADTYAGLATAETTGAAARFPLPLMTELDIPDLYALLYRMNSGDTSFHATPAIAGVPTLKFTGGDDDLDYALLHALISTGATKFVRIVASGTANGIAGATPATERVAISFPGKIFEGEEPGEQDGALTNTFTMVGVHDATSGMICEIQTISDLALVN